MIQRILNSVINPLIILLFAVALLVFAWGVFEFVSNTDSEEGKKKGAQHILWGIIGLFIMASVFGIRGLIDGTINSL